MNYYAMRELQDEATEYDYYREAYACQIRDAKIEAAIAEAEYEAESAVWSVVTFIVCFGAGDRFLAAAAVVEALALMGAHFRDLDDDGIPF